MMIKTGEKVQNNLTGKVYEVKMIQDEWIVLEGEGGLSQVLTETKNIKSLYEKVNESSR
jgi:hypothetical protein